MLDAGCSDLFQIFGVRMSFFFLLGNGDGDVPAILHHMAQGFQTSLQTSNEANMAKLMCHTLGYSLNIRHNLSSSTGTKCLQLQLLTTYIPKTSALTLVFSTSQRLPRTSASGRTFVTFRHYITSSAR